MTIIDNKCPNCAGALEYSSDTKTYTCIYCDSEFLLDTDDEEYETYTEYQEEDTQKEQLNIAKEWFDCSKLTFNNAKSEEIFSNICEDINGNSTYQDYLNFFNSLVKNNSNLEAIGIREDALKIIMPRVRPYINADETVLMYIDTGLFSKGKTGVLITDNRVLSISKSKILSYNYNEITGFERGMLGDFFVRSPKHTDGVLITDTLITRKQTGIIISYICLRMKSLRSDKFKIQFKDWDKQ